MLVGDVTGDSIPDLVAVNAWGVEILNGLGGGRFDSEFPVFLFPVYSPIVAAVLTDFNGDKAPDLVLDFGKNSSVTGQIQIAENRNGVFDLSLANPILYSNPGEPKTVVVGNFEAQSPLSGYPDLVIAGESTERGGNYGFELMLNNSQKK